MNGLKKVLILFIAVTVFVWMMVMPVSAASMSKDGIEVTLTTNKEDYVHGELIKADIAIRNTNEYAVSDVYIQSSIPDGYELAAESQGTKYVEFLEAGQTVTFSVTYEYGGIDKEISEDSWAKEDIDGNIGLEENKSIKSEENKVDVFKKLEKSDTNNRNESKVEFPKIINGIEKTQDDTIAKDIIPGDETVVEDFSDVEDALSEVQENNQNIFIEPEVLAVGGVAAGAVAIGVIKRKKWKKLLSLLLSVSMVGMILSVSTLNVSAANINERTIEVSKQINVSGEEQVIKSIIRYAFNENENGSNSVTKEEWIVSLVELVGMDVIENSSYSFDDYMETSQPDKIETAVRMGCVPLNINEDNMVYFNPKENVTREFLAYTTIRALMYEITNDEIPQWEDSTELIYPYEDAMAVKLEIINLENNSFLPDKDVSKAEIEQAKIVIQEILNSTNIDNEADSIVNYNENVSVTDMLYNLDEESGKVYTIDGEKVMGWKEGDVHIIESSDGTQKDIAVKVISITEENGYTVIQYEEPELSEVVTSFHVEGVEMEQGEFIPAEGVVVTDEISGRAVANGSLELWGKKNISFEIDDITIKGSIDLEELEYRFIANPSWHLVSIDEVYLAVNSESAFTVEYNRGWEAENGSEDESKLDKRVKLGTFKCPLPGGFNVSGDIFLILKAKGGFEVGYEFDATTGIQYVKGNGIRPVNELESKFEVKILKGEAAAGVALEPGTEFLGIDFVKVGAEIGGAAEGEVTNLQAMPFQICIDGTEYIFLNIYGQIGWDDLNLRLDKEIFNVDNSFYRKNIHIEETGIVDECTRGNGNYQGRIVRADDPRIPVSGIKVQVLRGTRLMDTTYTDSHGNFIGTSLPSGTYTLRISGEGYIPYEQDFDIVGGECTTIETQLMISRDDTNDESESGTRKCSGSIYDAYTGGKISGALIEIRSQYLIGEGELLEVISSDGLGNYNINLPMGKYELTVIKDGYITNKLYVTVAFKDITEANVILNPERQTAITGNLRVVLKWGEYPRDLDSHMVGPNGDSRFHVYYVDKNSGYVELDVDDTTSYGPETVTINQVESGKYSYYVHDFSNRLNEYSTSLSDSAASIQLYNGDILMYTINIPVNQEGTLWHVFDYDSDTGLITLVNEFSYESHPGLIGGEVDYAYLNEVQEDIYEKKAADDLENQESEESIPEESETKVEDIILEENETEEEEAVEEDICSKENEEEVTTEDISSKENEIQEEGITEEDIIPEENETEEEETAEEEIILKESEVDAEGAIEPEKVILEESEIEE